MSEPKTFAWTPGAVSLRIAAIVYGSSPVEQAADQTLIPLPRFRSRTRGRM